MVTALNQTRITIFNGPLQHSLNVTVGEKQADLDLYATINDKPGRIEVDTYREFYEHKKEHIIIRIKKDYIKNIKEMYYWYKQAIITAWAKYTDQFPENREKTNHTGLTLLDIPEPLRGSLSIYKKHYGRLGVKKCVYCNKRPVDAIDHVIPWKMVKNDQSWNMLPICKSCNSSKLDRIGN